MHVWFGLLCLCLKDSKEAAGLCVSSKKNAQKRVEYRRKFVKMLSAFKHCYGAEVHYLNSSKHRKLIEPR